MSPTQVSDPPNLTACGYCEPYRGKCGVCGDGMKTPGALATGTLLLNPDDYGSPRIYTVTGPKTLIYVQDACEVKSTLKKPGLPDGWIVLDNRTLARQANELRKENQ